TLRNKPVLSTSCTGQETGGDCGVMFPTVPIGHGTLRWDGATLFDTFNTHAYPSDQNVNQPPMVQANRTTGAEMNADFVHGYSSEQYIGVPQSQLTNSP